MKKIKKRKPRSEKNISFCGQCMSEHCDSRSEFMTDKLARRREEGVHFSCGNNPCTCKSRGTLTEDIWV